MRDDTSISEIPCMVLCAGTSARFGRDKMLADLDDKPVVAHVLDRLKHQTQILSLNASPNTTYVQFNLPVVADCIEGALGPLVGVLTAMKWAAAQHFTHVMTCAGDTPFIPHDWAQCLGAHIGEHIVVSQSRALGRDNTHYVCALWPVDLVEQLERDLQNGQCGVGRWIGQHDHIKMKFEHAEGVDPFYNINTQADLEMAESLIQRVKAGT